MTGLLNPKCLEVSNCFKVVIVVYLGHGMFNPVQVSFIPRIYFLGERSFWGIGLDLPNRGTSRNRWCTSIVARFVSPGRWTSENTMVGCGSPLSRAPIPQNIIS